MAELFDRYEKALAKRFGEVRGVVSTSGAMLVPRTLEADTISVSGALHAETLRGNLVEVSGSLSVAKDAVVGVMEVSGSVRVRGSLEADEAHVSGSLDVGECRVRDSLYLSGSLRSRGGVTARYAEISGGCSVSGEFCAEEAEVSGGLKASRVTGDRWRVSGSIKTEGDVRINDLEIELYGVSRVNGIIAGRTVKVRRGKRARFCKVSMLLDIISRLSVARYFEVWHFPSTRAKLSCKGIEAEEVYIEGVECDYVKGRIVVIGPGSVVRKRVVYSGKLEIDPEAKVEGEIIEVEGPEQS